MDSDKMESFDKNSISYMLPVGAVIVLNNHITFYVDIKDRSIEQGDLGISRWCLQIFGAHGLLKLASIG